MGGGNGQKAKMARERNLEKLKGAKGIFRFSIYTIKIYLSVIQILLVLLFGKN